MAFHPCAAAVVAVLAGCGSPSPAARPTKVYVCAQVGVIDVRDGETLARVTAIPVGEGKLPHNVVIVPGGAEALVTSADAAGEGPDELLIIDTATDTIAARVDLEVGALAAHVVVSPDGRTAYVTGWASSRIYRVDLVGRARLPDILMVGVRRPHGLRLSADGERLYTANSQASVSEIHAASGGTLREFELPGSAVQVAVGSTSVYATVSYPPAVARIDLATGEVAIWPLVDAAGPAQLTLSPDERTVYVADQGLEYTPGNRLIALDAATGAEQSSWEVGTGAHGVALTADGDLALVTSLFDNSLAVVDLSGDAPTLLERTGRDPSGVALLGP